MSRIAEGAIAAALAGILAACGGGGGGSGPAAATAIAQEFLTVADVQRVIAQSVGEAQARGVRAQVAVVDRVGNVLAVFAMEGAPPTIAIASGLGVNGGLDGIPAGTIPASHSAISKAVTGAYLSSQGNAFSTRTASQIVQEHFLPQESRQPSGPLYGVQFSQLTCSDINTKGIQSSVGPKRSPLGLSADPGGLPLYKNGVLVGGVGIESNGIYALDRDITDIDESDEELVAVAGTAGFGAPTDIRAERITADGRTFRYVDSEALKSNPAQAPAFAALPGALSNVPGYVLASVSAGTAFGTPASGVRPDTGPFAGAGGWILVDAANFNRFPPRQVTGSITAAEVQAVLAEALAIAQRARGQIRRPLGSIAHVSIALVDPNGDILGLVRTSDAPVFGIDVAAQKARTALFFSHPIAGEELAALPPANHLNGDVVSLAAYGAAFRAFTGTALDGSIAWTPRAVGNLHRPFFPDGIDGTPNGPLSTPIARWSPFNVGFQLDLVYNQLVRGVLGDLREGCTGIARLRNGAQIFPGGVPIYRGDTLVAAIGVSGDGVDQDDMVSYLAVANAGRALGSGLGNAPAAKRADQLAPLGSRLRYVQCPQSPFNGSNEQNVCG